MNASLDHLKALGRELTTAQLTAVTGGLVTASTINAWPSKL